MNRKFKTLAAIALLIPIMFFNFYIGKSSGEFLAPDYTAVYFCPQSDCITKINEQIAKANESIDMAVMALESEFLADSLIKAKNRGVVVRVLLERSIVVFTRVDRQLAEAGVEVRYDNNVALLHNKFTVIDNQTVVTGSLNYLGPGHLGREDNIVVINSQKVAELYAKKFSFLFETASTT